MEQTFRGAAKAVKRWNSLTDSCDVDIRGRTTLEHGQRGCHPGFERCKGAEVLSKRDRQQRGMEFGVGNGFCSILAPSIHPGF